MKRIWSLFLSVVGIAPSPEPQTVFSEPTQSLDLLIGKICKTITPLRKAGYVEYDGLQLEAESNSAFIGKNQYVEVVGVVFKNRLVVKPVPNREVYRWLNLLKS